MTSECVFSRAAIVTLIVSDRTSSTVICGYASFICAITEGRTSVPMISLAATRTTPRNPVAPELKLAADRSIIMAVSTNHLGHEPQTPLTEAVRSTLAGLGCI